MEKKTGSQAPSNAAKGKQFELTAKALLEKKFGVQFEICVGLPIGEPERVHKFDLVSTDKAVVVECKTLKWTAGGFVPPAKLDSVKVAVFYLSFLPTTTTCFVAMDRQLREGKSETLAEYYIRAYGHLLGKTKILEIDVTTGSIAELG